MRIGLIPPDERPANVRYPRMVGAVAGAEVTLPPPELLSAFREPAAAGELAAWLRDEAPRLDALVVSLDMLGYGGLVPSRITEEPVATVLSRLEVLRELRRSLPGLKMYGSILVTRIPNANDATEEPEYWGKHGELLHRYSQALDREARGKETSPDSEALRRRIPERFVRDFVARRLRNHAVDLAALELVADETLDFLVVGSDDANTGGLASAERRSLAAWADRLALGSRALLYPGDDEIGCALVARLVNRRAGRAPNVGTHCAVPGWETLVAPYEDGPISRTVERQVLAVGGRFAGGDAPNLLLALNPPADGADWIFAPPDPEADPRERRLPELVDEIARAPDTGTPVAVADAAYANGADPSLVGLLRERVELPRLAAYGGWKTAGNTIGAALAHGCAALAMDGDAGREAHERLLLHRFLEDWGYAAVVRDRVKRRLIRETGRPEPDRESLPAVESEVEGELSDLLGGLPGLGERYRVVPGSVTLPRGRTFECDFELERRG